MTTHGALTADAPVPFTLTPKAHAALDAPYTAPLCPGDDPGADWQEMGWCCRDCAAAAHLAWCPDHPGYHTTARVDEIEARAAAAPGGCWIPFADKLRIPWSAHDDEEPVSAWCSGRYLVIEENDWHGAGEPPESLWQFLAHAREDVLALAAEVRRLRAGLGTARQCADYYDEALAREAGLL